MANSLGTDVLIQTEDPIAAARFYIDQLDFQVTGQTDDVINLHGNHINLFIERGPKLGPVLEVTVPDVAAAKASLLTNGCTVVKDEPHVPRCYIQDPYGLIYNLTR